MQFFEFLVFACIEIPQLSDCPEGATVAPSHGYLLYRENFKFQDVIFYDDTYMLSL